MNLSRHPRIVFSTMLCLLLISAWISASMGPLGWVSLSDWGLWLRGDLASAAPPDGPVLVTAIEQLRLPRAVLAIVVGSALAVAGLLVQGLFLNPLAEPYLVGVSAGAALGAVLALVSGAAVIFGVASLPLLAFAGALSALALVYRFAGREGSVSTGNLLLSGIAVSGIFQAVAVFLLLRADPYQTREVLIWLMGSLAYRGWDTVLILLPVALAGMACVWAVARPLNLLSTGEASARALGLRVESFKIIVLGLVALLAASTTAACGIIAFAGLIVPHICRYLVGANHLRLVPATMLGGAILLLWADVFARLALPGQELPISVITGAIGCIFFLTLMTRSRSGWFSQ